ncbi:AMP-binding protein [Corallococcus sp. 4LFB]|uniref:AMP-binding protein n=1 Tax=Corallococcus sp. 4LFB TaxID=3383249 RepID=UPI003975F3DB
MSADTAPSWVRAHAAATPDAPAVDSPWARLTYAQLEARMLALAGQLRAAGVEPGARVLIALPLGCAAAVAGSRCRHWGLAPWSWTARRAPTR